jgi:hypothetical protein
MYRCVDSTKLYLNINAVAQGVRGNPSSNSTTQRDHPDFPLQRYTGPGSRLCYLA